MLKLLNRGVNFYKVIIGIVFSLVWARVMYLIFPQPSYLTFVWFYLVIGSLILKWVLFEIVDRVDLRIRVRKLKKELDEADKRVKEAEGKG